MPRLFAHFTGLAERSGPLAFGHANMVRVITLDDDQTRDVLAMVLDVPDLSPERVVDIIALLLERHESLRTTYRLGDVVTQHVAGSGALAVDVIEADADPAETALRTAHRLRGMCIELTAELPLRAAIVTRAGIARHLVLVISHVAMDVAASEILLREWTSLASGGTLPPAGMQPLDVIEFERKPSMRRLITDAIPHWESQVRELPQAMFPLPADVTAKRVDWHPGLRIRSVGAVAHVTDIATRTGAGASTVMLAAVKALVCYHTGHTACVTSSVAGNRVARAVRDLFGTISQDALMVVPVPENGTFDDVVLGVRSASLAAYRASWFDPTEIWKVINGVSGQRGISYNRDLAYNDVSSVSAGSHDVVTRSARGRLPAVWIPGDAPYTVNEPELDACLESLPAENVPCRFAVYVYRLDTELDVIIHADPRYLAGNEFHEFGRALLRLLAAAADRDLPIKELATLTTLTPMVYPDGWFRIDSCRVELVAVRDLLAEVLDGRPHLVVAVPDALLGHRLVCYLTGPESPEDIHRRCMALLWARVSTMAPHDYVVCAGTPLNPSDADAWAALPVLVASSGRDGSERG